MRRVSDLLLNGTVKFEVRPGEGYLPFQGCIQKVFPEATAESFPFAFGCPLLAFGGGPDDTGRNRPAPVWELLPGEVLQDCNRKVTLFFICDVIDALAVAHGWNEQRVGEWLRTVEDAMQKAGFDERGRNKHR